MEPPTMDFMSVVVLKVLSSNSFRRDILCSVKGTSEPTPSSKEKSFLGTPKD